MSIIISRNVRQKKLISCSEFTESFTRRLNKTHLKLGAHRQLFKYLGHFEVSCAYQAFVVDAFDLIANFDAIAELVDDTALFDALDECVAGAVVSYCQAERRLVLVHQHVLRRAFHMREYKVVEADLTTEQLTHVYLVRV